MTLAELKKKLLELAEPGHQAFTAKLIPTVPAESILGIRTPKLRALAKSLAKTEADLCQAFKEDVPHTYLEENHLHAFLIEAEKDFELALAETNQFLPLVDNWATCDSFRPKVFAKHKADMVPIIKDWLKGSHAYTQRYAMGLLMANYLDEAFQPAFLQLVAQHQSDHYYVKMMMAWYLATALSKQWDATLPIIQGKQLDPWVHNKAIQKARESFRISPDKKDLLKTLKI